MRWLGKEKFRLFREQTGIILIEILVGLALLGIITVGILNGLTTTFKGIDVGQERVAAESLAKSQIEYIKVQDYIPQAEYDPVTNCYEQLIFPQTWLRLAIPLKLPLPKLLSAM